MLSGLSGPSPLMESICVVAISSGAAGARDIGALAVGGDSNCRGDGDSPGAFWGRTAGVHGCPSGLGNSATGNPTGACKSGACKSVRCPTSVSVSESITVYPTSVPRASTSISFGDCKSRQAWQSHVPPVPSSRCVGTHLVCAMRSQPPQACMCDGSGANPQTEQQRSSSPGNACSANGRCHGQSQHNSVFVPGTHSTGVPQLWQQVAPVGPGPGCDASPTRTPRKPHGPRRRRAHRVDLQVTRALVGAALSEFV